MWVHLVTVVTVVTIVSATSDFTFQSSALNDYEFQSSLQMSDLDLFGFGHVPPPNESCSEVWCELPPNSHHNYYDDLEDDENGFWLEPPPDDILYMPPPPMPPALQAYLMSMENDSFKEFIISDDTEERLRCNFCKLFADPRIYEEPIYSPPIKENETFISSFHVLILSLVFIIIFVICLLIKYKKLKIFPSDSCPILTGGFLGKSSSSPSNSTSDTRISPVVNEKSPQSIIMDAPLASLGKKSTISTTGKYWKRIPASGNILYMEDRRLRSLGGSSTGISDHPYSDAASCTSSPVYAELDPSVAGSCHTPPIIGPPGTSFSPYAFSNTYSEVPDPARHGLSPSIMTDSSTYDNAAYLPATSQPPFLPGANNYATRSLRRLAAQRSAALSAVNSGQISTPLLAGHQYHPYHPAQHQHQQQSQQPQSQFHFLTGGRQLKKQSRPQVNYYKYGNTMANRPMNHYVTHDNSMDSSGGAEMDHMTSFSAFLSGDHNHHEAANRKSSSSSSQYTEMPLLTQSSSSPFSPGSYRMSETNSSHDLHSATSSSSSGTNSSSVNSSTSLKRPLPPVPGGVRL